MIEILNEEQLAVVKEQIERYDSLLADQLPTSLAEPLVDELHRLRLAVNSYERKRQV
jgi:hypothetical protein